jgi:AcrR family transcriptional regulator
MGAAGAAAGTGTAVPTRDRIVEAALRLFAERGTTAVSMRELADAADVTVPGLYYHFASKADLISEVYRARGFGQTPDEIELPGPAPIDTIIVDEARREFTRFLGERELGRTLAARWRERWVAVLGCATDLAPGGDLSAAADAIATFLWGLFVEYLRRNDEPVDQRIVQFARLIAPALR